EVAGAAASVYGVGVLCAAVAGGYLADRIGRRRTIIGSMVAGASTMLALSQARELWQVMILSGLSGLCSESYRPASSAMLADLVSPGQRVTAFATYRLAINAGVSAGPAIAGLLAQRSFVLLFVGDAVTSL